MAVYDSPRRYYHRKRMNARREGNGELEGLWRYKQEHALPATTLPDDFPFRSELAAHGYGVREDLAGVDQDELMFVAELRPSEAVDVLAALIKLNDGS